jgi:hypothetical protein
MGNFSLFLLKLYYLLLEMLDLALLFELLGMKFVQCLLFKSGFIFLFQDKQILQLMTDSSFIYLDLLDFLGDFELRKSQF